MDNNDKKTVELQDDALDAVTGGAGLKNMMRIQCECGTINLVDISKSSYMCKHCTKINHIDG